MQQTLMQALPGRQAVALVAYAVTLLRSLIAERSQTY